MDARLSRASIDRTTDPHDWNSYDHYATIHQTRLDGHPFVDHGIQDTVQFEFTRLDRALLLKQVGRVYCLRDVILEVEKDFETRTVGRRRQLLQVRCQRYRYIAYVRNGGLVLKYHKLHADPNEYHHRVYDPATGREVGYEILTRVQFPTFTEVLDEVALITRPLDP